MRERAWTFLLPLFLLSLVCWAEAKGVIRLPGDAVPVSYDQIANDPRYWAEAARIRSERGAQQTLEFRYFEACDVDNSDPREHLRTAVSAYTGAGGSGPDLSAEEVCWGSRLRGLVLPKYFRDEEDGDNLTYSFTAGCGGILDMEEGKTRIVVLENESETMEPKISGSKE